MPVTKDQIALAGSISPFGPNTNQNFESLKAVGLVPSKND